MSVVSTMLPQLPRTICDVASRRLQATTVTILAVFVVVMVLLGQPLPVAAGVAGWLVTVTTPASATQQNNERNEAYS